MKACVYFDNKTYQILDILPKNIDFKIKGSIDEYWNNPIYRKIIITLSMFDEMSVSELQKLVGHSISTIHDAVKNLENAGIISAEITYINNKKRMLRPNIIFVTKNPRFKVAFQKFFQGIWIDSEKTNMIIGFLQKNKDKYYSVEDIASKLHLAVDEVELLLSNWDSLTTRTLSNFLKERPFEKKVMYKGK